MTKFPENEYLFPALGDSSRLLVGCRREDYSASRIARAVEDCNAHVLNLNVTHMDYDFSSDTVEATDSKFPVVFDMRVSLRNTDMLNRSLERYGYTVLDYESTHEADKDTLRERLDYFFRILEP